MHSCSSTAELCTDKKPDGYTPLYLGGQDIFDSLAVRFWNELSPGEGLEIRYVGGGSRQEPSLHLKGSSYIVN